MTDRVLSMLYQFVLSNQSLQLNETFQIYCKILSVDHSSFSKNKTGTKKKKVPQSVHVGASERLYKYPWAFDTSQAHEALKHKCLLICSVMAFLQHLFFESNRENNLFLKVLRIGSPDKSKSKSALKILTEHLSNIFSVTNLKQTGPYQLQSTIILLSNTYKCQFFVFESFNLRSKIYYMYPEDYNDALKPVYLFKPKFDSNHIIFIKNINSFFTSKGAICFACLKSFKRNGDSRCSHLCRKQSTCFACRRFFQTNTTYINSFLERFFCDKFVTKESTFQCNVCNCDIYYQRCLRNHKRFCKGKGYFGYKCSQCRHFTYCSLKQTSEDLKKSHTCDQFKICRNCYRLKEANHLCKLKIEKPHSFNSRLAFFQIVFDQITSIPIAAFFLREESKRGTFTKYAFYDELIQCKSKEESNFFIQNYFEKFQDYNKDFFDSKKIEKKCLNYFETLAEQPICFAREILKFLMDVNFHTTTYICEDTSSCNLMGILSLLVNAGICPNILKKGQNIILIEIPEVAIRFIKSNNYVAGNEYFVANQFQIPFERLFFPEKLITVPNFLCAMNLPPLETFYFWNDTVNERALLQNAYKKMLKNNWNFIEKFDEYFMSKLVTLAKSLLTFFEQSLNFQVMIQSKQNSFIYVNPFNAPICSLGSFIYLIFKVFYLNEIGIYGVANEYGKNQKQVSKLEHEFCSLMDYKYPTKEFQYAFSNPDGAKYFKESIPDLYSPITNECFYFNGCYYHAHHTNCLINKNARPKTVHPFGKTYETINNEFTLKLHNLMNAHPEIPKITIEWECNFLEKKRSTQEFRFYFENNYISHCLKRLKPRDTVRGAYSDVFALKWSVLSFPEEQFYCTPEMCL